MDVPRSDPTVLRSARGLCACAEGIVVEARSTSSLHVRCLVRVGGKVFCRHFQIERLRTSKVAEEGDGPDSGALEDNAQAARACVNDSPRSPSAAFSLPTLHKSQAGNAVVLVPKSGQGT